MRAMGIDDDAMKQPFVGIVSTSGETSGSTPLANLHVSLLDKLGAPVERIGDSTGPLGRLAAGTPAERLTRG